MAIPIVAYLILFTVFLAFWVMLGFMFSTVIGNDLPKKLSHTLLYLLFWPLTIPCKELGCCDC